MILFQHAGGERADWEDAKVEKEGTHPVVYPAAGSHATFYDSAVYVQNGAERLRRRLRQHQRTAARTAARARSLIPTLPDHDGPLQVAHLLRPLGREGEGLQQRADRVR